MKVVVVGGGPAGIMASITASQNGHEVTLVEKNAKIGRKLYITGKGRCNVTNDCDNREFIQNVVSNPKFLMSAIRAFDTTQTQEFFENLGVQLKVERGNRVFPASDKSSDIIDALYKALRDNNVKVLFECEVLDLLKNEETKTISAIITNKGKIQCDHLVLATGGVSYPKTGSDGKGLHIAESLGHSIVKPVGGLNEIEVKGVRDANSKLISTSNLLLPEGLSLKNVALKVVNKDSGKELSYEFGEMLFTDKGLSGPIALTTSSRINRADFNSILLKIDLKPALDEQTLDKRILSDFTAQSNRTFINSLAGLLPKSLIPFIVEVTKIPKEKVVNSITKEERARLLKSLKELTFEVKNLASIERAIITAGGVSTKEISPSTMISKLYLNLSFAGEMIDVDAYTGGFNIQIALSTGYVAGTNI